MTFHSISLNAGYDWAYLFRPNTLGWSSPDVREKCLQPWHSISCAINQDTLPINDLQICNDIIIISGMLISQQTVYFFIISTNSL